MKKNKYDDEQSWELAKDLLDSLYSTVKEFCSDNIKEDESNMEECFHAIEYSFIHMMTEHIQNSTCEKHLECQFNKADNIFGMIKDMIKSNHIGDTGDLCH